MVFPWMLIASLLFVLVRAQSNSISLPGCPQRCGNVTIPYPFGTKPGCYLDENFFIYCDTKNSDPPKAFYQNTSINITEIMFTDGQMRIWSDIAHQCYTKNGSLLAKESNKNLKLTLTKFPISYSKNKFVVVGCYVYAFFTSFPSAFTGCSASCTNSASIINGSCTGFGCCQMSIPKMTLGTNITLRSFTNRAPLSSSCSYAFVVENTAYTFNTLNFVNGPSKLGNLPVILDWMIGNQTCEEAKKDVERYACKASSYCYDLDNGYRCNCSQGYEGNPYLPTGCQDIDECKVFQPCTSTCFNLPGSFRCSCPHGYSGDGRKDRIGCILTSKTSRKLLITLGVGVGIGSVIFIFACYFLYMIMKRSMEKRQRDKNFNRNGGLLLQQQISSYNDIMERTKIFTSREMNKATDHFNQTRILGQGGQGTVYKGMLEDGRIVAIKKSKEVDETQLYQFINEVVVLSQISHRNVVKLVGCCLETQVPLLVYEYVPNGTLYQHIHSPSEDFRLTWKTRVHIAAESAGALAHLHSSSSTPVYHRDIKSSNILLDEKYRAKVSDFGISRNISIDQTHLTATCVQGTLGYLDPEYFHSYQFTEKSDVYSFGVVLVELLTSKKALQSSLGSQEHKSLIIEFLSVMESSCLFDVLDPKVLKEGREDELMKVASLACRCLDMIGKNRPRMKEVAMILEGIRSSQTPNPVEEKYAIGSDICSSISTSCNEDSSYYSSNFTLQESSSFPIDVHPLLPNSI
ncbi:LOW QUALITY PROTEIN: hypothetical protein V2J09_001240 [Rumex salicifolius]